MICLLREVERILSLECERVAADCGTTNRRVIEARRPVDEEADSDVETKRSD